MRDPLRFLRSLPAHGDLVQVLLGPHPAIVVCDPALVRHVLGNDRTFDKGGIVFDVGREILGNGLGFCPHHEHRRQRRLAQPAFRPSRLVAYSRNMTEVITAAADSWADGQIIDVQDEMMKIATAVVLAALFGTSMSPPAISQAIDDLTELNNGAFAQFILPAQLYRICMPAAARRFNQAKARHHTTFAKAVTERRADDALPTGDDLLSIMTAARGENTDEPGFSDQELSAQASTFFIGGAETTATTLSWSLHLLSRNPEIRDRLQSEVDAVLAGRATTHDDLPNLPFTRHVIAETLRLYPPLWLLTRTTTTDTRLGGHCIPKGTTVIYSPYLIHHRPDLYHEPERFDPDRWTTTTTGAPPRDAFLPFGAGVRKCIGDQFGLNEATLALATITSRWHLQPPADHRVRPHPRGTLRPAGLKMRVTTRTAHESPRTRRSENHDC